MTQPNDFDVALATLREFLAEDSLANFEPSHLAVLEPGRAELIYVEAESESEWPGLRARGYNAQDWSSAESCSYGLQEYDEGDWRWHLTGYGYLDACRPITDEERDQVAQGLGEDDRLRAEIRAVMQPGESRPHVEQWITPPECQGQMVEVSYGLDHGGTPWQRTCDADRNVSYKRLWDEVLDDWEPWNREPRLD